MPRLSQGVIGKQLLTIETTTRDVAIAKFRCDIEIESSSGVVVDENCRYIVLAKGIVITETLVLYDTTIRFVKIVLQGVTIGVIVY